MQWKKHEETIFFRLLAALLFLTIIPPAVLGYIIYSIHRTSHIDQTGILLRSLAADRELATRLVIELRREALKYLAEDENALKIAHDLGESGYSKNGFLDQAVRQSPFFIGLSVVDATNGRHVEAGVFPRDVAAFSSSELKELQDEPLTRSEALPGGETAILIAQPIPGVKTGIIMLGMTKLTMLNNLYGDRSMLGETGESFLTDSSGMPMTALRYSTHMHRHDPIEASAIFDCLKGNRGDFIITPDYVNEATAMSYRPIEGYGGCVMVHMRASEIMGPVNTIRNMAVAIVAAIVLATALMSYLLVRRLLLMGKVRAALEEDLARHASQLQKMVSERTSQLEREVQSRIEAEGMLRENKSFLEKIVHSVHEVISIIDVTPVGEYRLAWWNSNGERLTGISTSLARGLTIDEVCSPENWHKVSRYYVECASKGVTSKFEERLITAAGPKVFLTTLVPVKDESGRTIQIISSAMDVTERRHLESEMVKAQKLESLGVLAGGLAHDFNNYLAVIRLNLSLLKNCNSLGPDELEILNTVETSSAMAANLTNQLLTFARGGKPVKKPVPLEGLLRDVAVFSLRGAKSALKLDISKGLCAVEADAGQITQVINNMLINADQAMPEGGVVVLSARNVQLAEGSGLPLAPGDYVQITIEDTGIGIAEKDLPRVFDPYFTTKKGGSGLGLSSAYSVIKNHNGHITVKSGPETGTVFEIFIPSLGKSMPLEEKKSSVALTKNSGTVLVMDDDGLVRKSVCMVLESIGYSTTACAEGSEAVLQYKKAMDEGRLFDAVILDLTVPGGMGGQEAVARILELDPSAMVFVSSGYSDNSVIADYDRYGFCGVLKKPYDAQELDRKLRAALRGRQGLDV